MSLSVLEPLVNSKCCMTTILHVLCLYIYIPVLCVENVSVITADGRVLIVSENYLAIDVWCTRCMFGSV